MDGAEGFGEAHIEVIIEVIMNEEETAKFENPQCNMFLCVCWKWLSAAMADGPNEAQHLEDAVNTVVKSTDQHLQCISMISLIADIRLSFLKSDYAFSNSRWNSFSCSLRLFK